QEVGGSIPPGSTMLPARLTRSAWPLFSLVMSCSLAWPSASAAALEPPLLTLRNRSIPPAQEQGKPMMRNQYKNCRAPTSGATLGLAAGSGLTQEHTRRILDGITVCPLPADHAGRGDGTCGRCGRSGARAAGPACPARTAAAAPGSGRDRFAHSAERRAVDAAAFGHQLGPDREDRSRERRRPAAAAHHRRQGAQPELQLLR